MWMVPIYSISSFLSLVLKDSSPYLDVIRDFYECFVIHAFVAFLIAWCGSEDQLASKLRQKPPSKGAHLWPMSCCLPRWRLGRDFLWRCKWGTLQYIVVKTTCAIATLIMQALDVYGEGEVFSLTHGYLYVSLLSAVSQTYAIYCLVLFYHAMSGDLAPMNPVPKFLTVKAVVFATWAQSVAVAAAVQLGLIAPFITAQYSEEDIAKGIQNFAICVEMFIAALLHRRIFSFRQYSADSGAGEYSYESLARLGVLPQGGGQGDHMGFGRGQPIPGVLRRGISPAVARLAMDSSGSSIGSDGGGWDAVLRPDAPGPDAAGERGGDSETGRLVQDPGSAPSAAADTAPLVPPGPAPPPGPAMGNSTTRPFLRAFIESTIPMDVVADIGRTVSRSHRQAVRDDDDANTWVVAPGSAGKSVTIRHASATTAMASTLSVGAQPARSDVRGRPQAPLPLLPAPDKAHGT